MEKLSKINLDVHNKDVRPEIWPQILNSEEVNFIREKVITASELIIPALKQVSLVPVEADDYLPGEKADLGYRFNCGPEKAIARKLDHRNFRRHVTDINGKIAGAILVPTRENKSYFKVVIRDNDDFSSTLFTIPFSKKTASRKESYSIEYTRSAILGLSAAAKAAKNWKI